MNELQLFTNERFGSVRMVYLNGQPFFVGKDVADILGYSNARDAMVRHVDLEDKKSVVIHDGIPGNPNQVVINESGLYSLILGSKLPTAKQFKHWITSEVLPSIHKHGLYATDELLSDPDLFIRVLTELKESRAKAKELETLNAVQAQQIAEMKPKTSYYDIVLQCPDLVSISKIAKDYGKSVIWLNMWLSDHKIQYKQGSIWLLYQKYADKGYTQTKTYAGPDGKGEIHSHVNTYWTQKGRLFIYEQLKADGIVPTMEGAAS